MPVSERRHPVRPPVAFFSPRDDQARLPGEADHLDHDLHDVCGIILAGSQGWGDGDFERILRGPLVPVAQTPLIRYAVEWLHQGGVRHAAICANHAASSLREYFGDGSSLGMSMSVFDDSEPRGPAGCAHDAARHSHAGTFVVVEGCMIPGLDLAALLAAHRRSRAVATVVVEVERRRRSLGTDMRSGGGIYVFDRRVLESVSARGYHDIKEGLIERLYTLGERVAMHEVQGIAPRVVDCSTYASVNRWLITRALSQPLFLGEYLHVGTALVHPTARVATTARLLGPVIVGAGAEIGEHAVVVGPSSIGARSRVSAFASVSRTVLWEECAIGTGAVLDASVLADGVTVRDRDQLLGAVRVARRVAPRPTIDWALWTRPITLSLPRPRPIVQLPKDFVLPTHGAVTHSHLDDRPPLT